MRFELRTSTDLENYTSSLRAMEERVHRIYQEDSLPFLWFLEYPPLFTQGRSVGEPSCEPLSFPLFKTNRGGKTTYHGPGQRIVYVMMDLKEYGQDVKLFVYFLEEWIIETLKQLGVQGKRAPGRTGVWVNTARGEEKIAAIGVRLQKWVTSHGFSLNVSPDLTAYDEITPCGLKEHGVTSLKALDISVSLEAVDQILLDTLPTVFNRIMKGVVDGYC